MYFLLLLFSMGTTISVIEGMSPKTNNNNNSSLAQRIEHLEQSLIQEQNLRKNLEFKIMDLQHDLLQERNERLILEQNFSLSMDKVHEIQSVLSTVSQSVNKTGKRIAFSARIGPGSDLSRMNGLIIFDAIIENEGGGYDTTTGTFTAPENGHYLFYWTLELKYSCTIYLSHNNHVQVELVHWHARYSKDGMPHQGIGLLHLMRGDRVCVKAMDCNYQTPKQMDTFMGIKLVD